MALGDSLTAGYRLAGAATAFPVQLEQALKAKGIAVEIANAGVSGDTASGGLARLDWSVPDGTDAVILELGANDMLRGIDPKVTREALDEIVRRLKARHIAVLLCGMRAAPNLGPDYGARVRRDLSGACRGRTTCCSIRSFSTASWAIPSSTQRDGLHPTGAGVAKIVAGILPKVEELLDARPGQDRLLTLLSIRVCQWSVRRAGSRSRCDRDSLDDQELNDAATVHRSGNPASLGRIAVAAARRLAGRALDRSGKLSPDLAVHRRRR